MYKVTNPATGVVIAEYPTATDEQIIASIDSADRQFSVWKNSPLNDRVKMLRRVSALFAERAEQLAELVTVEMGKRLVEARGEISVVVDIFNYYADNAESLLADEQLAIKGGSAVIRKCPVGVLIGIMPWNYPYYQVARFVAPNLALGNTILLKHAPNCPSSALAIEKLLHDAGVPSGAFINIFASNEQIAWMIADHRVQGISLTGSERAGSAVAAEAGRNLKKVVLELGGSDPMIILDSDDIAKTVEVAVESRMGNMGQACNAPKRMIVMSDIYDEFVDLLTARMGKFKAGDPKDPDTTLAPLSSVEAAQKLQLQIQQAVDQGATLRTGGRIVAGTKAYLEATVLTDVKAGMKAHHEELFGPVAVVYRVESENEAIALANDTPFGLGSGVFSKDPERARRIGEQIDAGMVYLNAAGGSQADLPFGGIKRSGLGRELGYLGIEEFMNKKVVRL
jgi:succinate-semialdehyde dehydrogenase / glutarate-semialdehyde dehydrogenase